MSTASKSPASIQMTKCSIEMSLQQNPIPTNKPGVEPKRPPRPVNITTNVKLSPTVANNIHVSWCTDFNRGFVISAYLVKKLTSKQLLQRMQSKGTKPIEYTRTLSEYLAAIWLFHVSFWHNQIDCPL